MKEKRTIACNNSQHVVEFPSVYKTAPPITATDMKADRDPYKDGSTMIKDLTTDEAILSQPCEVATSEDESVAQDLLDTMMSLDGAACLAANQIGITKCIVAYLDDDEQPHIMYNPILKQGLAPFKTVEGCLTRESESKVTRFDRIKVAYDEMVDGTLHPRKKSFTGWTAQIIQHMIDHCKGKAV